MSILWEVLLYYKYVPIDNPDEFVDEQTEICRRLNLKGRIIVAKEGINGTIEGRKAQTDKYIAIMRSKDKFKDMHFKRSIGTGNAFPRMKVKLRDELVSAKLGHENIDPNLLTGKYLQPEELHTWFQEKKKFYIVDMRNDYEHKVGHFENSILPNLKNFRDLPKVLKEIDHLKSEPVLTVCTGGVRCEKASGYLLLKGFENVYQLYGGIVSYMEKYPNENFLGKLYVFDNRVVMGFNTDSPQHKIISHCSKCQDFSDNYVDCKYKHCKGNRHFIVCHNCLNERTNAYCSKECCVLDVP